MSHLRQLLDILTNAVDVIEVEAARQHTTYPNVNDVFISDSPGEQLATNPAILEASALGASAASQLFATLNGPGLSVFNLLSSVSVTRNYLSTYDASNVNSSYDPSFISHQQ